MIQDERKPELLTRAEMYALEAAYNDLMGWVDQHQEAINNILDGETRGFLMGAVWAFDPDNQWARRYAQQKAYNRARSLANLARGRELHAAQRTKEGRQP